MDGGGSTSHEDTHAHTQHTQTGKAHHKERPQAPVITPSSTGLKIPALTKSSIRFLLSSRVLRRVATWAGRARWARGEFPLRLCETRMPPEPTQTQ